MLVQLLVKMLKTAMPSVIYTALFSFSIAAAASDVVTLHSPAAGSLQLTPESYLCERLKITGHIDARDFVTLKKVTMSVTRELDLSEATVMSPEKVNKDGISSRFLQLSYLLEAPKSVAPNEKFTVKVTALDGNGAQATEVNYDGYVVEAVDGYVPHRRCSLREGSGTFQAIALGLEDGEKMRLKFGRKYGTGLGECIVAIKS